MSWSEHKGWKMYTLNRTGYFLRPDVSILGGRISSMFISVDQLKLHLRDLPRLTDAVVFKSRAGDEGRHELGQCIVESLISFKQDIDPLAYLVSRDPTSVL